MSEEESLEGVNCCTCGIRFHFLKRIVASRRESGKTFYCPNGCSLSWPKPKEEIELLKKEIEELKKKLELALKEIEARKKLSEELQLEVDLWKPAETK